MPLIPIHRCARPGRGHRATAVVVAHAIVDDQDAHLAERWWYMDNHGYPRTWAEARNLWMHHAVFGRPPDGLDVSHENADKLDCRRANLALRTRSDNILNTNDRIRSDRKSCPYRGVSTHADSAAPWRGEVTVRGVKHRTGYFASPFEAAVALNELRANLCVPVCHLEIHA